MKALRFIRACPSYFWRTCLTAVRKWCHSLWGLDASVWFDKLTILSGAEGSTGIDSHQWESKIEILGQLSHGYF